MHILRAILMIIAFFIYAITANAATIYVNSSTGNDTTGDGSSGTPYKTFHKGYMSASATDTIDLTGTFDWKAPDETGDASTSGYTLAKDLTIQGQGADVTFIQAESSDNSADRRVFTIPLANTMTIQNLGIRYGKVTGSSDGGGIELLGTLTLDGVDVFSNRASGGSGGGVHIEGSALIQNSTVRDNVAHYYGGGLARGYYAGDGGVPGANDTLDIVNSTISGNTVTQTVAYLEGGGVFYRRGNGSVTNSTITNNQVVNGGTSRSTHGIGSGDSGSVVALKNNIIAGNVLSTNGGDIGHRSSSNGTFTDNGGNIIGRYGYYISFTPAATSWVDATSYSTAVDGTYVLQDGGATSGTLYLNSSLAANSSSNGTQTHAITNTSSIAVNNGLTGTNGSISVPTSDQRAVSRGVTPGVGAYELELDTTNPTVSYFSPADNATGVDVDSTFEIAFDENVATSTGNVILYKTTDDSTIETIDIAGALVSASSTNAFIINPSTTLSNETEYYFTIASTAVDDTSGNSYAGISASTTWSFTTADVTAPTISSVATSTTATTATITWTTDEVASTKVNFGLSSSYGTSTPETDTSTRVTGHSASITGLVACTRYNYQVQSTDASTNTATSTDATFTTTGCTGSATVTATGQDTITTASGGTLTQGDLTLTIPTSFTATSSSAIFQASQLDADSFFASASTPSGVSRIGNNVFRLTALTDATTTLSTFDSAITVTLVYTTADVSGIVETSLVIYRYDGASWSALTSCSVDTGAKTVTCSTTNFSDFAIFGTATPEDVVAESSGGGNGPIFVGDTFSLPGYVAPRLQTIYPDGKIVYLDENIVKITDIISTATTTEIILTPTVQPTVPSSTGSHIAPQKAPEIKRNLYHGIYGDDVKELQRYLNSIGYEVAEDGFGSVGNETTFFGSLTRSALARFQNDNDINPPKGYFGPITRTFLGL